MERRSFLASLLTPLLPVPKPQTIRTWEHAKFTGFRPAQASLDFRGQIVALRSDGEHFFVNITTGWESMRDMSVIREKIIRSERLLDSFRDCSCRVGHPCWVHRMPNWLRDVIISKSSRGVGFPVHFEPWIVKHPDIELDQFFIENDPISHVGHVNLPYL